MMRVKQRGPEVSAFVVAEEGVVPDGMEVWHLQNAVWSNGEVVQARISSARIVDVPQGHFIVTRCGPTHSVLGAYSPSAFFDQFDIVAMRVKP
jgi:hypothetical protein